MTQIKQQSRSSATALGARLCINLGALVQNYQKLKDMAAPAQIAAVVKANAYGLGVKEVALALAGAGVKHFFVALVSEGTELRQILNAHQYERAEIYVFAGLQPNAEDHFIENDLIPVLNSLQEIDRWAACGDKPAAIHIDTGMNRLGLSEQEAELLHGAPQRLKKLNLKLVMSHFACADEPEHPLNQRQIERFVSLKNDLPPAPASLSNSAGIFLGQQALFDLVRPGIALYGGNPQPGTPNPMAPVISLSAPILQIREVAPGESVGYGAAFRTNTFSRIAILPLGYADGFLRSFGEKATIMVDDTLIPIVGRISMDLIALDVTAIDKDRIKVGDSIEILGRSRTIDDLALAGSTIPYEILTLLGHRYERQYL